MFTLGKKWRLNSNLSRPSTRSLYMNQKYIEFFKEDVGNNLLSSVVFIVV